MNSYKNGREAKHLDQVVGPSAGVVTSTSPATGQIIAGTLQIGPDQKEGTGLVHVQDKNGVSPHTVELAHCFHAEDAYLATTK